MPYLWLLALRLTAFNCLQLSLVVFSRFISLVPSAALLLCQIRFDAVAWRGKFVQLSSWLPTASRAVVILKIEVSLAGLPSLRPR
jgi:hypothetical protein